MWFGDGSHAGSWYDLRQGCWIIIWWKRQELSVVLPAWRYDRLMVHWSQRGVVSERNNDVKTFVGIEAVSWQLHHTTNFFLPCLAWDDRAQFSSFWLINPSITISMTQARINFYSTHQKIRSIKPVIKKKVISDFWSLHRKLLSQS